MGCLYELEFPGGKKYIGVTTQKLERRLIVHRHHARKGRPGALQNAIRKYGEQAFSARALVIANDWKYLCELEQRAIRMFGTKFPNGYNLTDGGEGGAGHSVSADARRKISEAKTGKGLGGRPRGTPQSAEARQKISMAGIGRVFSDERRAKIGASKVGHKYNLGRPCSQETREKISAAQRGRPRPKKKELKDG